MALLGADTDELREVGQEFQEGKETTDQVITYLRALIAILKAASFFSGGASLAYAEYLETTVVPWLEKISQALGMFAQVLNGQAEAQDEASNGGTVDYGSLPTYTSPTMPEPITPYEGAPIIGGANAPIATSPEGSTGTPTDGSPLGSATTEGPRLTIGENGHLMIDTGIDLDGADGVKTPEAGPTGQTMPPASELGARTVAGPDLPTDAATTAATPLGNSNGVGAGDLGQSSIGSGSTGGNAAPAPAATEIGNNNGIGGNPNSHGGPVADGGLGGSAPGAESLGSSAMGTAASTGTPADGGPSYGAAAGIAGGAAALGLGGAALASRGGSTGSDQAIDKLASTNGRGSTGDDVRQLQERLTAAGYDTKGADGQWGSNTQSAYEAYRSDHPLAVQEGAGYTSPSGYDYNQITGVQGNPNVTPEFLRGVEGMAQRLGAQPEHIMAAMSFETGGSFASDVRNPRSSATGLIQFMDSTAQGLGTTTDALSQMSPTEQLSYVERYFEPHRGRLGDLESVYTSILAGSPHSGDDALFTQGDRAYGPNRELDANRNGVITAAEATAHVRSRMGSGGN